MVSQIITELRDDMGRSVGYTYAKNGSVQQIVSSGYGVDGRIASAGFVHGGAVKQFGYAYLNGTNLLQTLTMPNNMSLTQSFEEKRDLLTQMDYKRGATLVTRRQYTYDTLARPLTRTTSRQGQTVNDSFVHTYRSELASAQVNGETYGYDYDNIGNRRMAMEASDYAFYEANNLNQYTGIQRNEEEAFVPSFDADGNQTLIRTATGIWSVSYNAENRPVIFQKTTDSVTTRITCTYDSMGRRASKKVEEITTDAEGNESITVISSHRFIYRDYLQIACCDLTRANHPCLWLITWDPTQAVATRPLAIQKDGTWYCYGWDLTKNICEVFGQNGYIRTIYSYTPYGNITATGDITQPIQWSSEYNDTELALTYYNYRHYNPMDGRWLGRDMVQEYKNSYYYLQNNPLKDFDVLGKDSAKQRKKEETKKRRLANKEGRKINKEHAYHEYKIECQKHRKNIQKTINAQQNIITTKATGLGNIEHIFEAAIGSMELIHNSKDASVEKGIKLCHNAIANKHKNSCKACCYIILNAFAAKWGNIKYKIFSIYEIRLIPDRTCDYIKKNPGMYNFEYVVEPEGKLQGINNPLNPQKPFYEPAVEYTYLKP